MPDNDDMEERLAIMEYDGGLSRATAENLIVRKIFELWPETRIREIKK